MGQRVVVITGASGGVGRACAREFAAHGDSVALLARGTTGLEGARRDAESAGARAVAIPVDMADADAVEAAAVQVERELGPIEVWVNAAFTTVFARFNDISPEEFDRVTAVTYLGFVNGTRAALRRMQPRDRGTVVQVGSALGYRGIPLQSAYCAAKHAIKGFHESVSAELRHDGSGIQTTMVLLPAVNTPQFSWGLNKMPRQVQPVPPHYQPEVAARAIVYAAGHPRRREYWVGRSTVSAVLGERIAPGLLDRYVARTAVDAQLTPEARSADQPANLWAPLDGPGGRDYGAHGIFDDSSAGHSLQTWAGRHRGLLAGGALALAALGVTRTRRAA